MGTPANPIRIDDPPPVPTPAGAKYVKCDFCSCKLTQGGQVYEMSEQAYAFRDQKDTHAKEVKVLNDQIADLKRANEELQAKLNAATPSPAPKTGSILRI
jgi:hypothetical protein